MIIIFAFSLLNKAGIVSRIQDDDVIEFNDEDFAKLYRRNQGLTDNQKIYLKMLKL
jgi:hypothetical protein